MTTAAPSTASTSSAATLPSSIKRVAHYPVVKDGLQLGYNVAHSTSLTGAIYDKAEQLSQIILDRVYAPLQQRLPVEKVDSYANSTLDYVEKKFPVLKASTDELVTKVRKPADDAAAVAKTYVDNIQSSISPVTERVYARISQGQEQIHALQERLTSAISSLPRDKDSAQQAVQSLQKELESLSAYVSNNAKELPSHVQSAAKPLLDGFSDAVAHIRAEMSKTDVPIAQRTTNVLQYTREKVTPLLVNLKDTLLKKKVEGQDAAKDAADSTKKQASSAAESGKKQATKAQKKVNGSS